MYFIHLKEVILFLFELFCFLLHYILDVNGIEWNGAAAQLRYVETLQAIIIEGWFPLWKNKRLVSLALAVYIAEVRLAVKSVVALAGKDKPSAGMRPAVIGIALVAVHDAEAIHFPCLQVHHIEVSLRMPDREGAVIGYRKETVSAVRTYLRMAD